MDEQSQNPEVQPNQQPLSLPTQPNNQPVDMQSTNGDDKEQSPSDAAPVPNNPQPFVNPPIQHVVSSVYPEATRGIGISNYQGSTTNTEQLKPDVNSSNQSKLITTLIIIFGVYITLSALIGLIGTEKILSFGVVGVGNTLRIIDVIYVIIGAGIIFRKELARIAYVIIAIISLFLVIYGTTKYFKSLDNIHNAQQTEIQSANLYIANDEKSPLLSAIQKTQFIQQQENSEKSELQFIKNEQKVSYSPLIEGYLIVILPLVFLNLRIVKKEFS